MNTDVSHTSSDPGKGSQGRMFKIIFSNPILDWAKFPIVEEMLRS